jgi:hypothetical protein
MLKNLRGLLQEAKTMQNLASGKDLKFSQRCCKSANNFYFLAKLTVKKPGNSGYSTDKFLTSKSFYRPFPPWSLTNTAQAQQVLLPWRAE